LKKHRAEDVLALVETFRPAAPRSSGGGGLGMGFRLLQTQTIQGEDDDFDLEPSSPNERYTPDKSEYAHQKNYRRNPDSNLGLIVMGVAAVGLGALVWMSGRKS